MKQNVDDLFLMVSQGDRLASEKLFQWYMDLAYVIADKVANVKGIYTYEREDIYSPLVELYQITLTSFAIATVPFKKYVERLLYKRIPTLLVRESIHNKELFLSLDAEDDDGINLYDIIESPDYIEMMVAINQDSDKQLIASTDFGNRKNNVRIKRIMKFKELGYSRKEIMEVMNLTVWQYRYLERLISEVDCDKKFEMK